MATSRIALLRSAHQKFKYSGEWNPESRDEASRNLVKMIFEVTRQNPAPQNNHQARLEIYTATTYAREIIEADFQVAHSNGWLRDLYELVQDPVVFGKGL
ncbi:hypothetical protein [Pseudomonas putida]|uniref:Uncharacterized protein n=1 Tax=Pseudomonas putida TaxID=303 RepID=A0A8I1EHJ8_PSEPU|nr:hypothetical protein [Pseudomonas putida]MBI6885875.1 hypothetical protein [Pseudomonas putida]